MKGLTRFERACLGIVALAALVRVAFIAMPEVIWDSAWLLLLGRQFAEHGAFYLPWSEPGTPLYNGYWPPLYPIFVSGFVKVFGPSYHTLMLAAASATALLTAVVFFTTRDLYGRAPAFAAMALVAANPAFIASDSRGMSESLLATMVALTVWAFLKSMKRPAWLPVAAGFGFLAYLGKASLGLPIVGVGIAGLVGWRVWRRGLRATLRSPIDVGVALAGFVGLAVLAATRTSRLGGLGLGIMEPLRIVFDETSIATWALVFVFKLFFASAFLLVVTLPLSLKLREALRAPRTEERDALMLAVGLPLLAGAIFTTTFFFTEDRQLVDFDNIRYLTPSIVPMLWLLAPHTDLAERDTGRIAGGHELPRRHRRAIALAVGTYAALLLLNPMAPVNTLERLLVFFTLALIPLALSFLALTSHTKLATRKVGREEESRHVAAAAPPSSLGRMLALALAGAGLAWFLSAWFGYIALGLAIASTAQSPRARVLALALLLMCATAPGPRTYLPTDEAAAGAQAHLDDGAILGLREPIVYFAAIAPDDLQLKLFSDDTTPDDAAGLMIQHDDGMEPIEGWTPVDHWDYRLNLFPTTWVEQTLEGLLLGKTPEIPKIRAFTLFVKSAEPQG